MTDQETSQIQRSLGAIEGKFEGMMALIAATQSEIKGLREDFMTMEKGRLTALEVRFATLKAQVAVYATIGCTLAMIAGFLVERYFLR